MTSNCRATRGASPGVSARLIDARALVELVVLARVVVGHAAEAPGRTAGAVGALAERMRQGLAGLQLHRLERHVPLDGTVSTVSELALGRTAGVRRVLGVAVHDRD